MRLRGTVADIDSRSRQWPVSGRRLGEMRMAELCGPCVGLPFMRDKFAIGQEVLLSGKAKFRGMIWQMSHPTVQWIEHEADEPQRSLVPVYPATEGSRKATCVT